MDGAREVRNILIKAHKGTVSLYQQKQAMLTENPKKGFHTRVPVSSVAVLKLPSKPF